MRRRLFNLAAAVSLVLFVLTTAQWVRSYFTIERAFAQVSSGGYLWQSGHGRFVIYWWWLSPDDGAGNIESPRTYEAVRADEDRLAWFAQQDFTTLIGAFGIMYRMENTSPGGGIEGRCILVSYWLIALMAAIMPTAVALRFHRHRRAAQGGRCASCGYDLRATPSRCPECGTMA